MGFYVVQPEASGRPMAAKGSDGRVSCAFDAWLGDDLVRAHPLVLVTAPLKAALQGLSRATGFSLARVHATASPFFESHNPGRVLPEFWSVEVHGRAGVDDLALASDGSLVASARVVEVLNTFVVKHATFSQYARATPEALTPTAAR